MSGELPEYIQDIRWFHGELARRGLPKATDGDGSAFAERVAIKLDGNPSHNFLLIARNEALAEFLNSRARGV